MKKFTVVVVGVGAVGVEMIRLLEKRNFPVKELRIFARRERDIVIDNKTYHVNSISPDGFESADIALFAGTEGEKGAAVQFAHEAIKRGCIVIDNGADFRLKPDVPLVIPEINPESLKNHKGLIANPNCSTIQMVVSIYPIYKEYGIERIIVATFQSASGAGRKAEVELLSQSKEILERLEEKNIKIGDKEFLENLFTKKEKEVFPFQIAFNCFPCIGSFKEFDYTSEEWKMVKETQKILNDNSLKITATCVRIPVFRSHAEAIYIETKKKFDLERVKELLRNFPGVVFIDSLVDIPQPILCAQKEPVFVGRVRRDPFNEKGLWLWCVADNLWKGAALNAVQIAELLIKENLL